MNRAATRRLLPLQLLVLCLCFLSPLPAYYHFLHLRTDSGALRAIPERFDLREFPDGAVPYAVIRVVEPELADGEPWESVLSQIQLGVEQWSRVPNSTLRMRYAGEMAASEASDSPRVELRFEELPPGVIAMGGPIERGETRTSDYGEFVPIEKSVVVMSHRLKDRPAYSEAFYLTLVHETGHALGLQHTFTSGVMSTGVTRATTKSRPLASDDHAGIASLYPDSTFAKDTGVIRGKVRVDGQPLHFAPVTAVELSGAAVSSMTLPDGSYEIRGVPAGTYYVYAQPAPPSTQEGLGPGQIVLPVDAGGKSVVPGPLFGTRFYPNTANVAEAHAVAVQPGFTATEIDLDVPRRETRGFRGVTTYSFPGSFAVNPAVVNASQADRFFVAYGENLTENQQKASGLRVEALGAWILDEQVLPYAPAPDFLQVAVNLHPFSATGPRTLVWSRGEDVYVQPSGFLLVGGLPPEIGNVESRAAENGGLFARVTGSDLGAAYGFLFDGLPATMLPVDAEQRHSEAALTIPYTSDGRPVRITALGRDGQSSLFLRADPLDVASRVAPVSGVRVDPAVIAPGMEMMIAVESDAPLFADGSLRLSFASPSLVVRSAWPVSPNRLIANVVAMPTAPAGEYGLTLQRDLAVQATGAPISMNPGAARPLSFDSSVVDEATGDSAVYPGSRARVRIRGSVATETVLLSLAGRTIAAQGADDDTYVFDIPADVPVGVHVLELLEPAGLAMPVAVEVAGPPPVILSAELNRLVGSVGPLFRVRLRVQLPGSSAETVNAGTLQVRANGMRLPSVEVEPLAETADVYTVSGLLRLSEVGSGDALQVVLQHQGRRSAALQVAIPAP